MAYQKLQALRISQGLCKDCGTSRGENGTSVCCRPCAAKNSAKSAARTARLRAEWKSSGENTCNSCGTVKPEDSFKSCEKCRIYHAGHYAATGMKRRKLRRAAGTCASCSDPVLGTSSLCARHWLAHIARKHRFPDSNIMWDKLVKQDFRCYYTGIPLVPGNNCSVDHKVPKSRGGSNAADNLVWVDRFTNSFKSVFTDTEFIERCKAVASRF